MGMTSSWRFSHVFTTAFDLDVATRIGTNSIDGVCRFNDEARSFNAAWYEQVRHFFLGDRQALEVLTGGVVSRTSYFRWVDEVPQGSLGGLCLSEWTPIVAQVSLIITPSRFGASPSTLGDPWTCEYNVYEAIQYESLFPEDRKKDKFKFPRGRKCPIKYLSPSDFPGDLEWKLYSDMIDAVPDELIRRRGTDYFRDKYWDYNMKAMCCMFASSVTGVPASWFRLQFPDTGEQIIWDPSGAIIEHEKVDWERGPK